MKVKVIDPDEDKTYRVADMITGEIGVLMYGNEVVIAGHNEIIHLGAGLIVSKANAKDRYRKLRPGERIEITL